MARNYSRKKNTFAWIATLVAILMLAVAVTAAITQGFKDWNPWGWFDKEQVEETCEHVYTDGICEKCGEEEPSNIVIEDEESADGSFTITRALISPSNYADYGVSDAAESAHTLTATIDESSFEQGIDWTIAFKDAESEWATGKTLEEYVTLTAQDENAHTVVLECLQPFGEQISVTATPKSNLSVNATCSLDYMKRIDSVSGSVVSTKKLGTSSSLSREWTLGSDIITVDAYSHGYQTQGFSVYSYSLSKNGTFTLGVGTVEENFTENYTVKISDGLVSALSAQGITLGKSEFALDEFSLIFDAYSWVELFGLEETTSSRLIQGQPHVIKSTSVADRTKIGNALNANTDAYDFILEYKVAGIYSTQTAQCQIAINPSSLVTTASINMSESSIVF